MTIMACIYNDENDYPFFRFFLWYVPVASPQIKIDVLPSKNQALLS